MWLVETRGSCEIGEGLQIVEAVVKPSLDGKVSICLTNSSTLAQVVESGQTVGHVCFTEEGPEDQAEVVTAGEDSGACSGVSSVCMPGLSGLGR